MTTATLAQVLAGDLAAALDPCELAKRVNLAPDSWQAQLLRSTSKRQLVLCSRQSGKSTIAAVAACHTSLYSPGSLTLLVCPSERQSGELYKRCRGIFRSLGWPVAARTESALRIELENGSRIIALPGSESTVRGYSAVKRLILDEAARIPPELITAVRPMLAVSGGRLMALTTPHGAIGWFYEAWTSRDDTYERYRVTAAECPRISEEFLEQEKRALGHFLYRQEFECEFVDASSMAFDSDAIRAAVDPSIRPLGCLTRDWI